LLDAIGTLLVDKIGGLAVTSF